MKQNNPHPSAAGDAAQITDAQVLAFFKAKLGEFQAKMPGYASIRLDVSRHESGEFLLRWEAYHNDTGRNDESTEHSAECAIAWHFGTEVTKRKIQRLRDEAAEKIKRAEEMEAAMIPPPAPAPAS